MDLNPWVINDNPIETEFETDEPNRVTRVKVKFPWVKGITDAEYKLQISPNMTDWTDLETALTETVPGEFTDLLSLTAEVPDPSNESIFARLLILEIEL